MKGLIRLAAILGIICGAAFGAVRFLKLPVEYLYYVIALAAVVMVIGAIISGIRWIAARKARLDASGPKVSQEELDQRKRLVEVRATFKQLDRHQRAAAPARPRLLSARLAPPWIAVLGLNGHGKTRLLGAPNPKKLPEIDHAGPVKGADLSAAPEDRPRCFSAPGQAVYLEVPHALAHREDLRKAWLGELALLAKRGQPLHAAVLCVALDDLVLAADANARAAEIAELLTSELHDLVSQLQVHVPVFLVLTKLDRLAGFGELFAGIEPTTRPLGFELPDGRSEELALKEVRARYDALCGWLDRRALRLLSRYREPDAARQARIFTLVQQLAGLEDAVATIAQKVLAVRGGDPVRLRGVFLASATQDGEQAIDAVLDGLAKKTGGHAIPGPLDPAMPGKRSFADELVGTLMIRDGRLATRTQRRQQRSALLRGLAGGGLGLFGLWIALGSTGSAARNRELTQQTADTGAEVAAELGGKRRAPVEVAKLDRLRDLLTRWEDEAGDDANDVRGWGLFRGEVTGPLQEFYKRAVFGGVVSVLRDKAEAELRDFAARFESPELIPELEETSDYRDLLRFYLLITTDKQSYELQPISAQKDWLETRMSVRWSESRRTQEDKSEYAAIGRVVKKFLALAEDADFTLARDAQLIERAQEVLKRETSIRAAVDKLVDDISAEDDLPKINLRQLTGVPELENDSTEVRGAFTAEGWQRMSVKFDDAVEADEWILGLGRAEASERGRKRGAELRTVYFTLYIEEWRRFISRTRIVAPSSLDAGKQLMTELTRGPRLPLTKVFNELKKHTELTDRYNYGDRASLLNLLSRNKSGSRELVRAEDVKATFAKLVAFTVGAGGKDSSLDQYHGRLKEIRDAIGKALESKEEEKALVEQLSSAIDFTKSLVQDGELDQWTAGTGKLLVTPLEELLKMLVNSGGKGAVADWCARIVDPMYERFAGRYPFEAGSRSDAAVADFEEFFHPENGVIRKAREELLTSYVMLNGNTVELRDRGRSEGPKLDPGVVRFLNRAQDIGTVMFVNEELRVDFEVILACNPLVSRVEFTVDGKKVVFECTSDKPTRMRWPGEEDQGASLQAFGRQNRKTIDRDGDWGLYKLLEEPPSVVPEFKGEEVLGFRFDMTPYNLGVLDIRVRPTRVRGGTAFFGLPNGSRQYLALVRAPDVLPPKRLFTNMAGCEGG